MARKPRRRVGSAIEPETSGTGPRERVDLALNRLSCVLTVSRESADDSIASAVPDIAELLDTVRALGSLALEPSIARVASAEATDVTGQVYGASGGRGQP